MLVAKTTVCRLKMFDGLSEIITGIFNYLLDGIQTINLISQWISKKQVEGADVCRQAALSEVHIVGR